MSGDQGRAHLYKGAGAVILLLVALIIFFKGKPDEPFQSILEWSTANHSASAITNGIDRLAVMEDFNQLDTHITDRCFAPVKLDPRQFWWDFSQRTMWERKGVNMIASQSRF